MAEMIIILRRDPKTGKQNIIVKLDSDPDALPIEHEQMHKQLVEKLIGKGLDPEDLGEIIVEREAEAADASRRAAERAAEAEAGTGYAAASEKREARATSQLMPTTHARLARTNHDP